MIEPGPCMNRRALISLVGAGAAAWGSHAAAQARIYDLTVSRDPGCGCCLSWAEIVRRSGRFRVTVVDEADMARLKRQLGVPADLASCHTAVVAGYVVEGHVPVADILRLVEGRSSGVLGIAVAGMPLGSPGMEQPGGGREPFDVIAFRANGGRALFARHPGA
jgi:hypothetical protein